MLSLWSHAARTDMPRESRQAFLGAIAEICTAIIVDSMKHAREDRCELALEDASVTDDLSSFWGAFIKGEWGQAAQLAQQVLP